MFTIRPEPIAARAAVFRKSLLFCMLILFIVGVCKCCIQFRLLIYKRQKTDSEKQSIGVKSIILFVCRIKTTDMHITQSMNKSLITYIYTDVRNRLFFLSRSLPSKENKITRLHITKIRCYINMLPYICLLRSIPGNNNIMHKKYSTHQTTTIHPFRRSTRP